VRPGAREPAVEWSDGVLRVKVREPAERGRANEAVEAAVARALGLGARQVAIVGGATGRRKWVELVGIEDEEVRERLRGLATGSDP
jgi:hypothetical protein